MFPRWPILLPSILVTCTIWQEQNSQPRRPGAASLQIGKGRELSFGPVGDRYSDCGGQIQVVR